MAYSRFSLLLGAIVWLAGDLSASAQGVLTSVQYRIVGTQLQVTPVAVSVPKGIAGSVMVRLANGEGSTNGVDQSLAQGAHVEAVFRGPSFSARKLVGRPGEALMLPPLNLVGDYQLDNIRLVDTATGATRLEGSPSSVPVQVFEQVLVSTVTSRPLSMQEITEKGIVVDENNFRAVEFEVGFVLDGRTISVKFPVVSPQFNQSTEIIPAAELYQRLVTAQRINDELARTALENGEFPPELQRPGLNIQIKGANFQLVEDPGQVDLRLSIPPIPALMVIPGNIGYLNQFFSVQIFTENGAPVGSGLSIFNVAAKLNLPPGPDGIRSTNYVAPGDDPLRMARVGTAAQIFDSLPITGPAPDRVGRFHPRQGGTAEFLVEGLQEGLHIMDLDLTADLDGLAAGTVRIAGKVSGSVLVRNPKFSMSFSHPKTVRSGEPYNAYVTILNTGSGDANLVSVTLPSASLSGGLLDSPSTVQLGTIGSGQSATATFRVIPQRTGSVKFSNLTTGENSVQGRFILTMGIDERGVELSPDTMALPDFVNYLPPSVLETANRVLGQALSAATAPLLPAGVKPVGRGMITKRILELAEAGQRLKYLETTNRVLLDLILDWQGGRSGVDEGFDQILRTTEAGRQFRTAVLAAVEAEDTLHDTIRLLDRAGELAGRSEPWLLASSSDSGLEVGAEAGDGIATLLRSDLARVATYAGQRGSWVAGLNTTNLLRWTAKTNVSSAELAVVLLQTNGTGQQWRWNLANVPAGACLVFDPAQPNPQLLRDQDCDGTFEGTEVAVYSTVTELPPTVLLVQQDISVVVSRPQYRCTPGPANNYGQVLAVLFSKPMLQTNAAVPEAYQLDNGVTASGVRVQPGGRVALISLKEGVSAIRPRTLTVNGITDQRGHPVVAEAKPVVTTFRDGVAINGRVLRADGTPAVGVPVTVTMYDPWKDPFDRCEPTIITRTCQEYTDTNGLFSFDFVHGGVSFTVAAVDTGGLTVEAIGTILDSITGDKFAAEKLAALAAATNALATLGVTSLEDAMRLVEGLDRAVWSDTIDFNSGRMGQEMTIGLRFRGRGMVMGKVVAPDGLTPIPSAAVNLYPDPDSREQVRGKFTGTDGRFDFNGVPLGLYTVSVKTGQGHFRTVMGNLVSNRETNEVTIVLTAPVQQEIVRTSIQGRVVEPDNVTPHPRAKVFITAEQYGVVGALTADEAGYWKLGDIPAGPVWVRAFSNDGRRKAETRSQAVTNSVAFVVSALNGTGTVVGRVETSAGVPVANAIVAGGEALVRTDANGFFRTTGVPQGPAVIAAGLEARYAPGGFARKGSGSVTVLPEVENYVVVRLPAVGQIVGRVTDANGSPVTGVNVAIPMPEQNGFAWVKPDGDGRFTFPNIGLGDYVVSAPAPPAEEKDAEQILEEARNGTDDQIMAALQDAVSAVNQVIRRRLGDGPVVTPGSFGWTKVKLLYDGETAIANFQYLPEGKVSGVVRNDQGFPIGAKVRLTGPGLDTYGMPTTVILGDRTSDAATGEFNFFRLPQGVWALQAASPFYPVVLVTNGVTTRFALDVTNVTLQFPERREYNGRLAGTVLLPDGTPAGAGVNVKISFGEDYVIRTDTNGFFDTQIALPARGYGLEAHDVATGLRGQASATVKPGQTNFAIVQLLGKGALQLTVKQADGSAAVGALVQVDQGTYPQDHYNGSTDTNGVFALGNVFEGKYGLKVSYLTGAAKLEGNVGITVELGQTNSAQLLLGPTGTIRGLFRNRADGTPVVAARVSIGNAAYPSTDTNGAFQVTGLALGTYRLVAREPVSGQLAIATATLSFNGQVVDVNLTQLPQGELRGIVYQSDQPAPIGGAVVTLSRNDGITPAISVTTGPDGSYSFLGVTPGEFHLKVQKDYSLREYYTRFVTGNYPDTAGVLTVDITLPPRTVYGTAIVQVYEPGGTIPATNATVNSISTGPDGRVVFENLRHGSHTFLARSTRTNQTSSAGRAVAELSQTQTNVALTITLSGVGRLQGQVLESDNATPAFGAEVRLRAINSDLGVLRQTVTLTDTNGDFTVDDLPLGNFEVSAVLGALASSGSGRITNAGQTATIQLKLGASGSVIGRLLRAGGTNVVVANPVSLTYKAPSGLDGIASAVTDVEGRFRFDSIPVGTVNFTAVKLDIDGLAKVRGVLVTNGEVLNLGDIRLTETWPYVAEVTPAIGEQGVSTGTRVEIVFSEPMATNSIFADGIYLRGPSNAVPAALSWPTPTNGSTRVVWLTPTRPLESLRTYRLFVLAGVIEDGLGKVIGRGPLSLVDRSLVVPFTSSFSTRDDDPPTLVSLYPSNNAVQIDPTAVMRLSFNEPVVFSNLNVTLTGPAGAVSGQAALGFNGTVLTFAPTQPLAVNASYILSVAGVRDVSGNGMTNLPITSTFNTLDTQGPLIGTLRLADGQQPVAGGLVQLEALLAETEPGVSVRFTSNFLPVGQATNAPFRVAVRLPPTGSVTYRAVATDRFGNDGPVSELALIVVANEAPVVTLQRGFPGNAPVPSGSNFVVNVSTVDDLGVTNVTLSLSGPTNTTFSFPDGVQRAVLFTVPATAVPGIPVIVRARATDALGVESAEASLSWPVADGTPPVVSWLTPTNRATLDLGRPLELQLAVLDNSTNLHIRVTTSGGLVSTNEFDMPLEPNVAATNLVSIALTNAIRTGGSLRAEVVVSDGASSQVAFDRTFTLPDIAPPRIVAMTPADGSTRLSLWTSLIDFTFSETLATASFTTNLFVVTNSAGLPTPYTVISLGNGARISFAPPLRPGTTYTARLLPGIMDTVGNLLADSQGQPLPNGTNFTIATAPVSLVSPTNDAPVWGGDLLRVSVDFDPQSRARYYRFGLTGVAPVDVDALGRTNATADLLVPLNATNLVLTVQASDDAGFTRPCLLDPVPLHFQGNRVTNQAPSVQVVRVNPTSGPVAPGQTFRIGVVAVDDFGVTNLTLAVSGAISTNASFGPMTNVVLALTVPTNATSLEPIHFAAVATDTAGVRSTNTLEVAVVSLTYPFAPGTLFYSRGPAAQGTIWAIDPSGNAESLVTSGTGPVISPNGRYLGFGRDTTGDRGHNSLYVRDLATGQEIRVAAESGQWIINYDWLRDGTNLVYDYGCEVHRVAWNGANQGRFFGYNCYDDAPSVNPLDGRIALHNTSGQADSGLELVDANGTNRRQIPNTSNGDTWPAWSWDGEWISFLRGSNLFKIRPDGLDRTQLTFLSHAGDGFNPVGAWTADGGRLIAAGIVGGTNGLWSVATDGSGLTLVRADSEVNYGFAGKVYATPTNGPLPVLVKTTPAAGAAQQPLWLTNVTLNFNRALNAASVTTNGVLFSGGSYQLTSAGSQVTLRPGLPLEPSRTYSISINNTVTDLAGQAVAPATSTFTTARILEVSPTNGTEVTGGSYVTAAVNFDASLGANYFSFALNTVTQAIVPVAAGATQVSAPLLIPLSTSNLVLQIAASSDQAFSAPYALPPVALKFGGNSGTNAVPIVRLDLTSPASGQPLPGGKFSVLVSGTSSFGVTNLTLAMSGAMTANYRFTNGGPVALTFEVPAATLVGSTIVLTAQAVDALGVASSSAVLNLTVAASADAFPVGTILYSRAGAPEGAIWRVGLDGSNDQFITAGVQPRISPDHSALLFGREKSNIAQKNIFLRDLTSGLEFQMFAHGDYVVSYDWTPDSSQFVYDYQCGIYQMSRDGTGNRLVLSGNCYDDGPAINRHDGRVAWHNDRAGNGLVVAAADYSGRYVVTNTLPGDYWPQWSPDGEWLAFIRSTTKQVFKVRPDGTGLTPLTTAAFTFGEGPAVWTPDGSNLVFAATMQGTNGIYVAPANGLNTLSLVPTTPGSNIQSVASVVWPKFVPQTAPVLLAVSPSAGATRQPLWSDTVEYTFSQPIDPATVTAARLLVASTNGPLAVNVETTGNLVRVRLPLPLAPGVVYTNALLPGLAGLNGVPVRTGAGSPVSPSGVLSTFTTAGFGTITPTNGTRVVAGQSFTATANYDTLIGAKFFRFRLSPGAETVLSAPFGYGSIHLPMTVPASASTAVLTIEAADDATFARRLSLPPIALNVQPLGAPIVVVGPGSLTLTRGELTNLALYAQAPEAPLAYFGLASGYVPPTFLQATPALYTNTVSSGSAGLRLVMDSTFVSPGTYAVPVVARTSAGASVTNTLPVTILENSGLALTRWKAPISGSWQTASNWTAGVPGAALPAVIDLPGTYTVTLNADVSIGSLTMGAEAGTQTLDLTSRALRVQGSAQFGSNAVVNLGTALGGAGTINFAGQLLWAGGGFEVGGPVTLMPSATILATNVPEHYLYRVLNNYGTIVWHAGNLRMDYSASPGTLNNLAGGLVDLRSDSSFFYGAFNNSGRIQKLGPVKDPAQAFTTFNTAFRNDGVVRLESGGLVLQSTSVSTGRFEALTNTTIYFDNNSHTLAAGSAVDTDGDLVFRSGTTEVNGGFDVRGLTHVDATARFNSANGITLGRVRLTGTFGGVAAVTITNSFAWENGSFEPGGVLWLGSNCVTRLTTASEKGLYRTLNNAGTLLWQAGSWRLDYSASPGTLNNFPGGTVDVQAALRMNFGSVNNYGLFQRSGAAEDPATQIAVMNTTFRNDGLVKVLAGGFELQGASSSSGKFETATNSALYFSGSTHVLTSDASVAGGGDITIVNGTVQTSGSFACDGLFTVRGTARFNQAAGVQLNRVRLQGTLESLADTLIAKSLAWESGSIAYGSTVTLGPDCLTTLTTIAEKGLYGTLNNHGTVQWQAGNLRMDYSASPGTLNNLVGGVLDLQSDLMVYYGYGLNNYGILRKSGGSGVALGRTYFRNFGVVFVDSGRWQFENGGQHFGSFNLAEGASLAFNGSTQDLWAGTVVAGPGEFVSAGSGTVNFNPGSVLDAEFRSLGGTVNFNPGSRPMLLNRAVNIAGTVRFNTGSLMRLARLDLTGHLAGTDPVTIDQLFNWTSGTMSEAGITTVAPGATLTLSGAGDKNLATGRVLINAGTMVLTGSGRLWVSSGGATLNNQAGALLDLQSDTEAGAGYWEGLTLVNAGTLRKSAGTGTSVLGYNAGGGAKVLMNLGRVEVQTGTLQVQGLGVSTNSGSYIVATGALLEFHGGTHWLMPTTSITGGGNLKVTSGVVNFLGSYNTTAEFRGGTANFLDNSVITLLGDSLTVSGGTVNFESGSVLNGLTGTLNITAGRANFNSAEPVTISSLNLSGVLGGTGTVTVQQTINWPSGGMADSGTTALALGGTMVLSGTGERQLSGGRVFSNGGTVTWTGSGRWWVPSGTATLNNLAGGVFDIQTDSSIGAGYWEGMTINNLGTMRKSAGSGTTVLGGNSGGGAKSFNNHGVLQVNSGTIQLQNLGSGTSSGRFEIATGAALEFNGGTHVLTADSSLAGAGLVRMLNGTATVQGGYELSTVDVTGGTLGFAVGARITGLDGAVSVSGGTLRFSSGKPVTLGELALSGTLGGTDRVAVSRTLNWTGGSMTDGGVTVIPVGATLNLTGSNEKSIGGGRSVESSGTITLSGSGRWWVPSGSATINNLAGGVLDIQTDATCGAGYWEGLEINNLGLLKKTSGVSTTVLGGNTGGGAKTFNNQGTVELTSGILQIQGLGSSTNRGTFQVAAGTTLEFNGGSHWLQTNSTLASQGTVRVLNGAVDMAGTFNAATLAVSGGSLNFSSGAQFADMTGTVTVSAGALRFNSGRPVQLATLSLGGTLGGIDTVTIGQTLDWSGGTMGDAGTTLIQTGALATLTGSTDKLLVNGRSFNNAGTVNWMGTGNWWVSAGAATINNLTNGTIEIQNDASCGASYWESLVLNNAGLLRKNGGTNVTVLGGNNGGGAKLVNNRGTFQVDSGSLQILGLGSSTNAGGRYTVGSGALLDFGSGTHTFDACQFSGSGTNRFGTPIQLASDIDFGTLSVLFEGNASVAGNYRISNQPGGTIVFAKSMTLPGSLDVGGTASLSGANLTVQVTRTFTLEATGTLNNPGTFRVGAFVNNGGTVVGNAPIVIGLPPGFNLVRITGVAVLPASGGSRVLDTGAEKSVQLTWQAEGPAEYVVETSTDLVHWQKQPAVVKAVSPQSYQAVLSFSNPGHCFFRVLARTGLANSDAAGDAPADQAQP